MLYHVYRLPWRSSLPRSGSRCSRGVLYLSAGIAVIGKINRHVRYLPLEKEIKYRLSISAGKAAVPFHQHP